jgi:hypothetical protein
MHCMVDQPTVYLDDADVPGGQDWMAVIVERKTGVRYEHQYGGHLCAQGSVEGFLVPVFHPDAYVRLRRLFEDTLGGTGTDGQFRRINRESGDKLRSELRDCVSLIAMTPCTSDGWHPDADPGRLKLDEQNLDAVNEAWIPVITTAGRGVLVWPNSD